MKFCSSISSDCVQNVFFSKIGLYKKHIASMDNEIFVPISLPWLSNSFNIFYLLKVNYEIFNLFETISEKIATIAKIGKQSKSICWPQYLWMPMLTWTLCWGEIYPKICGKNFAPIGTLPPYPCKPVWKSSCGRPPPPTRNSDYAACFCTFAYHICKGRVYKIKFFNVY